jgi:hypothetical protein
MKKIFYKEENSNENVENSNENVENSKDQCKSVLLTCETLEWLLFNKLSPDFLTFLPSSMLKFSLASV